MNKVVSTDSCHGPALNLSNTEDKCLFIYCSFLWLVLKTFEVYTTSVLSNMTSGGINNINILAKRNASLFFVFYHSIIINI